MDHPGLFTERDPPLVHRAFSERGFTVGIGGPVGSGYVSHAQITEEALLQIRRSVVLYVPGTVWFKHVTPNFVSHECRIQYDSNWNVTYFGISC